MNWNITPKAHTKKRRTSGVEIEGHLRLPVNTYSCDDVSYDKTVDAKATSPNKISLTTGEIRAPCERISDNETAFYLDVHNIKYADDISQRNFYLCQSFKLRQKGKLI